ncbi:hypothetical protein [Bradyrhizobium canariense]|uniref:hypothetical protein n=1 Tax=Bradyrhizobium canariense TaxID=255045 RepID=UPI0011779CB9|nr:hypothetical protein [Bradyrhizobium canariense]
MRTRTTFGDEYKKAFAAMFSGLAREHNVLFYPAFDEAFVDTQLKLLDGLHPNAARTRSARHPHTAKCRSPDRYLRSLFTAGALAVIRYAKIHGASYRPWLTALLARRPTKVAAIALANKLARMAWAMMARHEPYKEPAGLTA